MSLEEKVRAVIYYRHPTRGILFCIATRAAGGMKGEKECLGGGIKSGEKPTAACERELIEETGFEPQLIQRHLRHHSMRISTLRNTEVQWSIYVFLLEADTAFFRAVESFDTPTEEVSALCWMPYTESSYLTPYQTISIYPLLKEWNQELKTYLPQ